MSAGTGMAARTAPGIRRSGWSRPTRPARRGARVLEALAYYTLHVHAGWDNPELRSVAAER
ncbi:MAG TPA: hypothetical protein VED20_09485 [Streptosporangiaceae bacterium]|nr:hypothetical protein [Streptosporangiaceae bacterium]